MSNYKNLLVSLDDGILTISINRPEKMNALNVLTLSELKICIENAYDDDAVKGLIVTGVGQKAFVAGADISEFTVQAAEAVIDDLMLAVILVSLVMLLFLHSLRNSLIVLISIPTSIISTFIVMYLMGYSLNLLSLLGLSLAIGILVDDSIVVIENITKKMEEGMEPFKAV